MKPIRYITPSIVMDYIDRKNKMNELKPYDPNISNADLGANLFVLVCLVAWIVYLLVR